MDCKQKSNNATLALSPHSPFSTEKLGSFPIRPTGYKCQPFHTTSSHPYPLDGLRTPYLGEFDEARYVFNLKEKAKTPKLKVLLF
jgi:hypothetical protein